MQDALEQPISPDHLRQLHQRGLLSEEGLSRGLALLAATPPVPLWQRFLSTSLLALGSALFLAGVIFFFAWNWDELGRFLQLGMIGAGVVAGAVPAILWRTDTTPGKIGLIFGAVMTGVLIAAYGQIYQTGADAWGLFALWAALILPWAVAARAPALWVLELVLVNTATLLWIGQVLQRWDTTTDTQIAVGLGALNALAWLSWEIAAQRAEWMSSRWAPRVMATWPLLLLVGVATVWVFEPSETGWAGAAGAGILAGLGLVMLTVRPRGVRDLFLPTAALSSWIWVADTAVARLLFEEMDLRIMGSLVMAGLILAEIAAAIHWIRGLRAKEIGR